MPVSHIGHAELLLTDLAASTAFFTEMLGLQVSDQQEGRVYLRAWQDFDHHTLQLTEASEPGLAHIGFRVADQADAQEIERELARRGLESAWIEGSDELGHGDALRFLTPSGHPYELYWEVELYQAPESLRSKFPSHPSRIPARGAAARRFDHVTLFIDDTTLEQEFLTEVLGLYHRYYAQMPDGSGVRWGSWLSRTNIAHEIGLGANVGGLQSGPHLHHIAYYLDNPADILRTATLLVDHGHELEFGPANHGTSGATCLYFKEPSGNRVELWTGGILMFAPDWKALEWGPELFPAVGDIWGSSHAPESFLRGTRVAPTLAPAKV
jgi:catechol 2,3-dioxygenase